MRNKTITVDFKKYRGKHIAIVKEKIVAAGKSAKEVLKKAKSLYPKEEVMLFLVPRERYFIYEEIKISISTAIERRR